MTELFVATGNGLAHIVPQGNDWTVTMMLEDSGMQCLALDPHNSDVSSSLFAALGDGRIYRSEDGGDTWQRLNLQGDHLLRVLALVGTT